MLAVALRKLQLIVVVSKGRDCAGQRPAGGRESRGCQLGALKGRWWRDEHRGDCVRCGGTGIDVP